MNTIPKLEDVELIYKEVDGYHYFIGNDHWSSGLIVFNEDHDIAKEEAMIVLRELLRINHGIRQGDWEIYA